MHVLWEADVAVFKAHITTGPSDKVLDLFWIYDNKQELPDNHRSAHIPGPLIKSVLSQFHPLPPSQSYLYPSSLWLKLFFPSLIIMPRSPSQSPDNAPPFCAWLLSA